MDINDAIRQVPDEVEDVAVRAARIAYQRGFLDGLRWLLQNEQAHSFALPNIEPDPVPVRPDAEGARTLDLNPYDPIDNDREDQQ